LRQLSFLESLCPVTDSQFVIEHTDEELVMLVDGLDALECWQYGDTLPRNNGEVFVPGDLPAGEDRC